MISDNPLFSIHSLLPHTTAYDFTLTNPAGMVASMSERTRTERGPSGQEITHTEHSDGRVDVVVRPAQIRIKARAHVVDISVSETASVRPINSKADVRGGHCE